MKSKQRVKDVGEVFTRAEEVNAMLDLVGGDISNPKRRILEPAAGNGNFLVLILERRMQYISDQKYKKKFDYERNVLTALSNIYGIDIMDDNVEECRNRLLAEIRNHYSLARNTEDPSSYFESTAKEILSTNIILGDSLNGKIKINFIEYKISHRGIVERRQFNLQQLENGVRDPVKVFEISDIRHLVPVSPEEVFYYNGDQMPMFINAEELTT
jgi:hypothetical protein